MKITELVYLLNWLAINLSINQPQTYKNYMYIYTYIHIYVKLDSVFIYLASLLWCKFNKSIVITNKK